MRKIKVQLEFLPRRRNINISKPEAELWGGEGKMVIVPGLQLDDVLKQKYDEAVAALRAKYPNEQEHVIHKAAVEQLEALARLFFSQRRDDYRRKMGRAMEQATTAGQSATA